MKKIQNRNGWDKGGKVPESHKSTAIGWIVKRRLCAAGLALVTALAGAASGAYAQVAPEGRSAPVEQRVAVPPAPVADLAAFADSVASAPYRTLAERATGLRVVVSLSARELWLIDGADTLRSAPVGIGTGALLKFEDREWRFRTPRGRRTVQAKAANPVWVPPDWHYAELAHRLGYRLVPLEPGRAVVLGDRSRLLLRGGQVVHEQPGGVSETIPPGEEIVIDSTVFVPPLGSANRRIPGELGRYKLDLGDGYLIHGTRDPASVGTAATHGCLRLHDDDLEFLFRRVPTGTPVYVF